MKPVTPKIPFWNYYYIRCYSVFLFLFLISLSSRGQCIPTTTRSPGTVVNDASIGSLDFNNENNAKVSDASRATATATLALLSGSTNYLKATGFGFTVPSYGIICGIEVEIQKSATGISVLAWIHDNQVRLVKGGSYTSANLAKGGDWTGPTDNYYTYGSSTEFWGATTLTPADVNASDFGVAISSSFTGVLGVFPSTRINHIRMTVYYNPILPTHIISFSSRLRNNNVLLDWKTADEEDGEIITVQRTLVGQSQWTDIARFDMHTGNMGKSYSYTDPLIEKGNYSYRLQITNNNGAHIYSATKLVSYAGNAVLSVYPNPAGDFISIDNIKDPQGLLIRNLSMQSFKLPVQLIGNNSVRIDTHSLPEGLYFVNSGTQQVKFIKQ